ncbi:MAG: efflux RND transporter periplasmic adaptor subunit [Noviherbaspirillum sp.]
MRSARSSILIAAALLLAGAGYYYYQSRPAPAAARPAPAQSVQSDVAQHKDVAIVVRANGYVSALNTVDVRPQTQNIVRQVHVTEGQDVRAGQLLFTLDQRSDTSNVDRARAQVARGRADLAEAENMLRRNQELAAKNFVSAAVVDTARSKVEALRSTLQADEAAIRSSDIALGNNRIVATMDGRIGAISVHAGSLAQPAGAPMLTISQLDPITVSFALPERELALLLATYPKGDAPVTAQLAGERKVEGQLVFIDSASDPQSGTIRMKARFANPQRLMWPGTFVNVSLVSRTLPQAVVIPAQAVVTGPTEKFVYLIKPDSTVAVQKVTVVHIDDGQAAVNGLKAGDRVVVEGAQNLRPGAKVREAQSGQGQPRTPADA